jgi:hypothetical protein
MWRGWRGRPLFDEVQIKSVSKIGKCTRGRHGLFGTVSCKTMLPAGGGLDGLMDWSDQDVCHASAEPPLECNRASTKTDFSRR